MSNYLYSVSCILCGSVCYGGVCDGDVCDGEICVAWCEVRMKKKCNSGNVVGDNNVADTSEH